VKHVRAWVPGLLIAAAALAFLAYGSLSATDSAPRLSTQVSETLASGFIASVTDGDTIRLADHRRIRLVQIDAPEVEGEECYAAEATDALRKLLPAGAEVKLQRDRLLDSEDRFGRVLAYVFKDGENVNLRLVAIGAAAPYFYRGARGRYAQRLLAAARKARAQRLGLWGACPGTKLDPTRAVATGA
jgi:endonuclease YncB( thermonuclease family)